MIEFLTNSAGFVILIQKSQDSLKLIGDKRGSANQELPRFFFVLNEK